MARQTTRKRAPGRGRGKAPPAPASPPPTTEPASPDHEHNLKARGEIINECATEMKRIKVDRAELSEDAGACRTRLRDAGISVEAFNYAQRVAEKSGPDRDAYMDDVHEQFMARGLGHQADFFKAQADDGQDGEEDVRPGFLQDKGKDQDGTEATP